MVQAVGDRQPLRVQKQLQKFMNWWLETVNDARVDGGLTPF
jgi:hypothetical protein